MYRFSQSRPSLPSPAAWAQAALEQNCLILDTETTGLGESEIVEIAIIDAAGQTRLHSYVRPVHRIPPRVTAFHGITNAMVADAPTWNALAAQVQALFQQQCVVVYNAPFDTAMLASSTRIAACEPIDWKQIARFECAMRQYARLHSSGRWQKLDAACSQMAVPQPTEKAHSALGDCLRTLGLLRAMAGG